MPNNIKVADSITVTEQTNTTHCSAQSALVTSLRFCRSFFYGKLKYLFLHL